MKENVQYTICSIKMQRIQNLFPLQEGFMKGTIYKVLYKPFGGDHNAC